MGISKNRLVQGVRQSPVTVNFGLTKRLLLWVVYIIKTIPLADILYDQGSGSELRGLDD